MLAAAAFVMTQRDDELTPQLIGLEGWRVEVETMRGERRRFVVSRSDGSQPRHIQLPTQRSRAGNPAEPEYRSVTAIRRVRPT